MSERRKFSIGNVLFGLVLLGLAGGAFYAGFYYTYGATVNVNTKLPGSDDVAVKPIAAKSAVPATGRGATGPGGAPAPKATPTQAPGLLAVASEAPSPTPTPAPPSPSPKVVGLLPVATPEPATPTPAPRRPTPPPTPKLEVYRVQVGGFDDRETAQKQVEELQSAGINAVVVYDEGKYHAQLGAFTDRGRALSVADEVNIRGYSVTIRH